MSESVNGETNLHVLVVDDDPITRELLGRFLRSEGHTVALADNGAVALDTFERDRGFDLFMIDVTMPVMGGLELCRQLKKRLKRWVPIMMISANAEESAQVAGLDIGADYYVTKPLSFPVLRAKVRASQRVADLTRELEASNERLSDYFNRNNADNDLARELLDRILLQGADSDTNARYIINPAGDFSGDMIVSTRSPAQRFYTLIADATGHGLPAAITLMPAVETFSRLAREGYSLEAIVRELNTRLRLSLPRGRFVAATLVMVEPHTHRLEVWNGGNPAAYLVDNAARTMTKRFPAAHPPLGVLSDEDFDAGVQHHAHRHEETFVACTDGVIEAMDSTGQMFGSARLERLLTSAERGDDLLSELDAALDTFTGSTSAGDDRTLYILPLEELSTDLPSSWQEHRSAAQLPDPREQSSGGWYFALGARGDVLSDAELAPLVNGVLNQTGLSGEEADRAHVCITELLNNAIDHGVLGLDSNLKLSPEGFETYYAERRKRLQSLQEGGVFIRVHLDHIANRHLLRVEVSDSGSGFQDRRGTEAPDRPTDGDATPTIPHGRGIRLVRRLSDRLAFHDGGATAEFHISITGDTVMASGVPSGKQGETHGQNSAYRG